MQTLYLPMKLILLLSALYVQFLSVFLALSSCSPAGSPKFLDGFIGLPDPPAWAEGTLGACSMAG